MSIQNCKMCRGPSPILQHKLKKYYCKHTGYENNVLCQLNCQSTWIIYALICTDCNAIYIGSSETSGYQRIINGRINTLLQSLNKNICQIDKNKYTQSPLLKHAKFRCQININNKDNTKRKLFAHGFKVVLIERVVDHLPTTNPFHIQYIAKARARLNLRERFNQANNNTIHTD